METTISDYLKDQLVRLELQYRDSWRIYLTFYTTFLVFNGALLALVVENITSFESGLWVICIAFALQNVISSVTALGMAKFSSQCDEDSTTIQAGILSTLDLDNLSVEEKKSLELSVLDGTMGVIGGRMNFLGHVVMIVVWLWVGAGYADPKTPDQQVTGVGVNQHAIYGLM